MQKHKTNQNKSPQTNKPETSTSSTTLFLLLELLLLPIVPDFREEVLFVSDIPNECLIQRTLDALNIRQGPAIVRPTGAGIDQALQSEFTAGGLENRLDVIQEAEIYGREKMMQRVLSKDHGRRPEVSIAGWTSARRQQLQGAPIHARLDDLGAIEALLLLLCIVVVDGDGRGVARVPDIRVMMRASQAQVQEARRAGDIHDTASQCGGEHGLG